METYKNNDSTASTSSTDGLPAFRSNESDTASEMLRAALDYAARGWSVIPLEAGGKRPLIASWKEYQGRRATEAEIRAWFNRCPTANLGIVTGAISGIVVLDFDETEGLQIFNKFGLADFVTPVVLTGRGAHVYFKHPGKPVPNFAKKRPGFDLRGDGGYVVAPPSIHATGKRYEFADGRGALLEVVKAPAIVSSMLSGTGDRSSCGTFSQQSRRTNADPVERYVRSACEKELGRLAVSSEGARNDTLNRASFALGQLVGAGALTRDYAMSRLLAGARGVGLSDNEAVATIESGIAAGENQPRDLSRVGGGVSQWRAPIQLAERSGSSSEESSGEPLKSRGANETRAELQLADFRVDRLTKGAPPERRWLVEGAVPLGVPGVIYGPGGIGKSMVALDLCLKIGTRTSYGSKDPICFLGRIPAEAAGTAIFITLEDDRDEIHRRVAGLDPENRREGAQCFVLPTLDILGFDPVMIRQADRAASLTEFAANGLEALLSRAASESGQPVRLLVLDPAGDLIEGNEDSAETVKLLMRRLREISTRHGCTVILLGHVAKGQMDRNTVADRGMRGSGAWMANARFAIGFWVPDHGAKRAFLKKIGVEENEENLERVVFGSFAKANQPGRPAGELNYLRDPSTGLWVDHTREVKVGAKAEHEVALLSLVQNVKDAAEHELPLQVSGGAGLFKRRSDLSEPLKQWGQKRLERLANEALSKGLIEKCRIHGSNVPCWLDVPEGPYATGQYVTVANGSLAQLRKAKALRGAGSASRQSSA